MKCSSLTLRFLLFLLLIALWSVSECSAQGNSTETTQDSSSNSTDTDDNPTTTSPPSNNQTCFQYVNCNACVEEADCVWCASDKTCKEGYAWGTKEDCADWKWKQCYVHGKLVIWIGLGVLGFVILSFCLIACLCKCFCCKSKKGTKLQKYASMELNEENESLISRHPKTDKRREELLSKYGKWMRKSRTVEVEEDEDGDEV